MIRVEWRCEEHKVRIPKRCRWQQAEWKVKHELEIKDSVDFRYGRMHTATWRLGEVVPIVDTVRLSLQYGIIGMELPVPEATAERKMHKRAREAINVPIALATRLPR
jgi:hypothetical protein